MKCTWCCCARNLCCMRVLCAFVLARSSLRPGPTATPTAPPYSLLPAGLTCSDAGLTDVGSLSECFGDAIDEVGLSGATALNGMPVVTSDCVYAVNGGSITYGLTSLQLSTFFAGSDLEYVCIGTYVATDEPTAQPSAEPTFGPTAGVCSLVAALPTPTR